MPAPLVKSFAKRAGVSVRKAERLWDKAKEIAAKAGRAEEYDYIVGILKRMLGLRESGDITFPDSPSLFEAKYPDQFVYVVSRREFPFVIDSTEKLERWMVERGMEEGKFLVATLGDSYFVVSTGSDWYRVLEMLFNTDNIRYESVCSDSVKDLIEVWGEEYAKKLLCEAMPHNIRAALLMRYLEIEKQLRALQHGNLSMDALTRSLRQAVYVLLNWLSKKEQQNENFQKFTGLV